LIETYQSRKIPILAIDLKGDPVLILAPLKTILVLDKKKGELRQMLAGYILTKNASILGRSANSFIFLLTYFPSWLMSISRTRLPFSINYQLISWRKGIRYRFIDIETGKILDWSKTGASDSLKREIDRRLQYADLIKMPKLRRYSQDGLYFEQNLVNGKSLLTQTKNKDRVETALASAFQQLCKLYRPTLAKVNAADYYNHLTDGVLSSRHISELDRKAIATLVNDNQSIPEKLYLCLVHGDINLGNLVLDSKKQLFIIDWEESQQLSITHDYFNMLGFLQHIHKLESVNFGMDTVSGFFGEILALDDPHLIDFYQALYFLERLKMWLEQPTKDENWFRILLHMIKQRHRK